MLRKNKAGIGVLLLCVLAGQAAKAQVHEYKLDNGLRLIVKEDHRVPVVVSEVWYKIGSSYEESGRTGLSHMLEHMMFKGTATYPGNEFSRIMADNGAQENAFTSDDFTAYYQKLEKSRLEISFKLEADRMRNLKFDPQEFAKEREVVIEERRLRYDDKPTALLYETFRATAYQTSPYQNPTIGWPSDLANLQLADVRQWYQQWYAPNNAIVVVAGDVEPDAVLALAQKYFAPLSPFQIEPPRPRPEVAQHGIKRVTVKRPAKLPYLLMGYKVPVLNTAPPETQWEVYALELLAYVLDGGSSARLTRDLVRGQEIATSLNTDYSPYGRLEELFIFSGIPAQGHTVTDLEQGLRAQIKALQDTPVDAAELKRVKAQLVAAKVYEQDSLFYQAMQIGQLASVGLDWRLAEVYLQQLNALSLQQLQAVAKKYLQDEGLTVAVLEPQPLDNDTPNAAGTEIPAIETVRQEP